LARMALLEGCPTHRKRSYSENGQSNLSEVKRLRGELVLAAFEPEQVPLPQRPACRMPLVPGDRAATGEGRGGAATSASLSALCS
jgi:hypothetical protein